MFFSPFEQFVIDFFYLCTNIYMFDWLFFSIDANRAIYDIFFFIYSNQFDMFFKGGLFFLLLYPIIDFFFYTEIGYVRLFSSQHYFENAVRMYYYFIYETIYTYLGKHSSIFVPFFSYLLFIITCMNVVGLIPYSYSLTSYLCITFGMAFIVWYGIFLLGIEKMGVQFFNIFVPLQLPYALAPLILTIELISTFFRVCSLSLRLFANVVAGHVLFELVGAFIFKMFAYTNKITVSVLLFFIFSIFFMFILLLFELFVSVLQGYIFTLLSLIYLRDVYILYL